MWNNKRKSAQESSNRTFLDSTVARSRAAGRCLEALGFPLPQRAEEPDAELKRNLSGEAEEEGGARQAQ